MESLAKIFEHLTPGAVLRWTGVIFIVLLEILVIVSLAVTMVQGFSG